MVRGQNPRRTKSLADKMCLADITSPSLDVPRGFFSPYSMQTRIIDVQHQGFDLIEVKSSELQSSEISQNSCFICA